MEVKLGIQSEQVDESQKFLDKKEFQDEEEVSLKDIKKFTTPFWILVISCVVVYGREE
jgi:hypothetical protein